MAVFPLKGMLKVAFALPLFLNILPLSPTLVLKFYFYVTSSNLQLHFCYPNCIEIIRIDIVLCELAYQNT